MSYLQRDPYSDPSVGTENMAANHLQPVRTTSRPGNVSFQETQHPRHPGRQETNDSADFAKRGGAGGPGPLPPKFTTQQSSSGFSTSSTGHSQEPQLGYYGANGGTAPNQYGPASVPHSGGLGGMLGIGQPGGLGGGASDVRRKKSLVKPDRERIDPNHRLYHYREHAAAQEQYGGPAGSGGMGGGGMDVMPSTTGNAPPGLRRGKSLLAREPTDSQESGLNIFKRGATLRRKSSGNVPTNGRPNGPPNGANTGSGRGLSTGSNYHQKQEKLGCLGDFAPGPKDAWMVYCYLLTVCVPGFVLRGVFSESSFACSRDPLETQCS